MAPVIHFDYEFSPYGQKTKTLLTAARIPFVRCDQPSVLPRPALQSLGITYRRIPLLAVGKDIYCDSNHIIAWALSHKPSSLNTSHTDQAIKEYADQIFNNDVLPLIPPQVLTDDFLKDREGIFHMLQRPDIKTLRPSALAQFRSRLRQIEHEFLANANPFINGKEISVADVHLIWPIKFAFNELGVSKESGFEREKWPKIYALIDALPKFDNAKTLSAEETLKAIREGEYSAQGPSEVETGDYLRIEKGTKVSVESFDSTPGSAPQIGTLHGTSADEFIISIQDGVRLHFPRIGYIVRPA